MTRPLPPHTDAAHAAITTELARLVLGGRGPDRPELTSTRWLDWDYLEPTRRTSKPRRTRRNR